MEATAASTPGPCSLLEASRAMNSKATSLATETLLSGATVRQSWLSPSMSGLDAAQSWVGRSMKPPRAVWHAELAHVASGRRRNVGQHGWRTLQPAIGWSGWLEAVGSERGGGGYCTNTQEC